MLNADWACFRDQDVGQVPARGNGAPGPPGAAAVPANLKAEGSLCNIRLTWEASSSGGLVGYSIPCVSPGQIEQNDFDAGGGVRLLNMTGGEDVPLGNNGCDFGDPLPALAGPPLGAGPDW